VLSGQGGGRDELPAASDFTVPPVVIVLDPGAEAQPLWGHACDLGMTAAVGVVSGTVEVGLRSAGAGATFGASVDSLHRLAYASDGSPFSQDTTTSVGPSGGADKIASKAFCATCCTCCSYVMPTPLGNGLRIVTTVLLLASGVGSMLVVPFGTLFAVRAAPGEKATLLKYCFVDASNVNVVKDAALVAVHKCLSATLAMVGRHRVRFPGGQAHVEGPARNLSAALGSLHLDTSMSRLPQEQAWGKHALWPKVEADDKAKRARKSQKEWQADMKWKWRIVALTLPILAPPTVT